MGKERPTWGSRSFIVQTLPNYAVAQKREEFLTIIC